MDITFVITVTALALVSLADNRFYAAASQSDVNAADVPQANRTSKELQEKSKMALEDPATELKTTGRKWTSNDYNTFSSLTSDIVVETSSSTASPKSYPSLTTSVPTFVTRGRYIRNPFYFSKEDQEVEFEDDQHGDVMVNNGVPRWNRYADLFKIVLTRLTRKSLNIFFFFFYTLTIVYLALNANISRKTLNTSVFFFFFFLIIHFVGGLDTTTITGSWTNTVQHPSRLTLRWTRMDRLVMEVHSISEAIPETRTEAPTEDGPAVLAEEATAWWDGTANPSHSRHGRCR